MTSHPIEWEVVPLPSLIAQPEVIENDPDAQLAFERLSAPDFAATVRMDLADSDSEGGTPE